MIVASLIPSCYGNRSAITSTKPMFVADRRGAIWQSRAVRTYDEILTELRRRRDAKELTNAEIGRWLKQPSSRVSEVFSGKRRIQPKELEILASKLWPAEEVDSVAGLAEEYATALRDAQDAIAELLVLAEVDEATAGAIVAAVPAIAQAARIAREDGLDARTAVATLSRHMWRQARHEGRSQ